MAETPDGYLWVATDGGLMRFDGARFQEFSLVNLDGVPNRVIRAMVLDHRGRLWLGMDRGPVVCLEPDAAHVFTHQDGLPDARASVMVEDAEGAIWIAYANGSVSRIQEDEVTLFSAKEGLAAGGSCSLAADLKGQLWFAKGRRVGVFRQGKFQTLLTLPESSIRLAPALTGGVWICAGLRLLKYDEGHRPQPRGELPEGSDPRMVLEDRTGAVWIGTATHSLLRCEGSKLEPVQTSYPEISCLMEGREGNLWVGTRGGGLNRLRPRAIELLGTDTGLPFESVRSVCEDANGALWVATQNGLVARQEGELWTTVSKESNWPGGQANCVASDRQGAIWIGTHRGLHRWLDGRYTSWRRAEGLASDNIRSLLASSAGDIWIATDGPGRLQRLHEGEWRLFDMPQRARSIRAMAEDAAGNIWMASAEGLLWRVSGDMVVNQPNESSGRPLSIRCLYAAADGSLWIGYAGWGVGRLKAGRFARITESQGLNDNYVSQMVADERGSLWFAGNRGVFEVGLEELAKVAEGKAPRVRSILFGRGEGLPNLQANYENYPGALRARDGRIWIPMRTGLAVVHTENIRDNPVPPPVLVERVAVDGQTVALYDSQSPLRERGNPAGGAGLADLRARTASLHLGPGHRKLEFEFTALSFTAPANVRFRYRLEGFDEDWVEADTRRTANYPRLPSGDYRFRVTACNNAGVWNETGASVGLAVAPFFWQTWWFRGAGVVIFTLSVIGIVRYVSFRRLRLRLRHLEQQAALHKERARIAKDIHDDVGANLTQISLLGELALQDRASPEKAAERTERISATARQAIKSLDEIVWAVNPRNDTLAHMIDYAGQFALDYLRLAGIRCRLDFPEQPPAREISTDARHNLFLAVKEALHNIVKHAQASEVWLRASANNGALELVVEDNGHGFARSPDDALADGLRNMRQRLEEVGGDCLIESQPGTGTKVIFRLPWPRN